jgi:hypothetical protein
MRDPRKDPRPGDMHAEPVIQLHVERAMEGIGGLEYVACSMDAKLDAKRLEELAALCEAARVGAGEVSNWNDLRDLARCAKAWAKVERSMMAAPGFVELFGYPGREQHWSWYPTSQGPCKRYSGPTAIAAVEATPEVGL